MIKKAILTTLILIGFISSVYSQNRENFIEINKVHEKFKEAFDSLDYKLFAGIHSERLIRIPGGKRIIDYNSYIEKYKANFEKAKRENSTRTIYVRFIERVNNDSIASERGIYKYVRNENKPDEKISYGKFHVLLVKEMGEWKILMDYDSSEGHTIDENDFNEAADINDIERFMK